MSASELYKEGKLADAIAAQTNEVKAHPGDHARRLFLFELLSFAGEWDKAKRQIDAIKYDEMEVDAAVTKYARLVDAEIARRRLFTDGQKPDFLADPPESVTLRLDAVNRIREGNLAEAAELIQRADEKAPTSKGTLDGKPFDSFRDADDLFGNVLEVMAHGQYYWVPLELIESLAMNPPKYPRDLIWIPARLETTTQSGEVFLPASYPGSHEHDDDNIKLGRMTDWKEPEVGPVQGVGLRTFLVGEDGVAILELRQLQFESTTA